MTKTNKKGTSLVELLAVIVIMGIIAAIAVPTVGALLKNTRQKAAVSDVQALVSSMETWVASEDPADGVQIGITSADTTGFYAYYMDDPSLDLTKFTGDWKFVVEGSKVKVETTGTYSKDNNSYTFTGTWPDLKAVED